MTTVETHGPLTTYDDGTALTLVLSAPLDSVQDRDWHAATRKVTGTPDHWAIDDRGGVIVWRIAG